MTTTDYDFNYSELARQIAARISPEALLSAEDVGAMLGYPARYIRETIALAPGFPVAIRLRLDIEGKRSNPRWRRTEIEEWVAAHLSQRRTRSGRTRQSPLI
jgi:predicted DNA-binding transcriptional regulator AlpA